MAMECLKDKYFEVDIPAFPKVAILVMVGLPGSGKTTLCHELPHILGSKFHVVHLCYDEVLPFHEEWREESNGVWKKERAKVLLCAEAFVSHVMIASNLEKKEKCTSQPEQSKDNKLSTSIVQNPSTKESTLKDQRNILFLNEGALKVNACIEKVHLEPECVKGPVNRPDKGASNDVDILEKNELVGESVGHYYAFNSLIQDNSSIDALIQGLNYVVKDEQKHELILLCVDDNCYYRSMRKEWWNLAAKYEIPFCTLVLNCDVETCIKRVEGRICSMPNNVNVPVEVIKRMSERLELPDENLYPWEKYAIILDSNSLKITSSEISGFPFSSRMTASANKLSPLACDKIKQVLFCSLLEPAKPLKNEGISDYVVATPSLVHRVDLALRRIVSESEVILKSLVNKKRKGILEDLRNGKLFIPTDLIDEESESSEEILGKYIKTLIDFPN